MTGDTGPQVLDTAYSSGTGPQVLRNTAYNLTSDSDTTHTFEMSVQSPAIAMIRN